MMQVGDFAYGGIYAGSVNEHHIICSPIEYDLPVRVNWFQATEYCKALGMELPTKEELNLLYKLYESNPKYFTKRRYQWYWSSTEISPTFAWYQNFLNGFQGTINKTYASYVSAIRRVKITT